MKQLEKWGAICLILGVLFIIIGILHHDFFNLFMKTNPYIRDIRFYVFIFFGIILLIISTIVKYVYDAILEE